MMRKRWVKFGFDGVKIDWCGGDSKGLDPKTQFLQFAEAIRKTNHLLVLKFAVGGEGIPGSGAETPAPSGGQAAILIFRIPR